jgi:myo-inositol-1(or 4)-monophosphatase
MDVDLLKEELTKSVCEIARRAGAYIREERRKFSLDSVERKHAHDYVIQQDLLMAVMAE